MTAETIQASAMLSRTVMSPIGGHTAEFLYAGEIHGLFGPNYFNAENADGSELPSDKFSKNSFSRKAYYFGGQHMVQIGRGDPTGCKTTKDEAYRLLEVSWRILS